MKKITLLTGMVFVSLYLSAQYTSIGPSLLSENTANPWGLFIQASSGKSGNLVMEGNGGGAEYWITTSSDNYFKIGGNGGTEPAKGVINIDGSGHIGINTLNTSGFTFNVNGTAVFDQVTVEAFSANHPNSTPWADYVFDKKYQLPSIYSVADFIQANHHLPGIPTTAEVEKNGIDLGATQSKLLEKIEQLTLYTIQLQQQVDSLKAMNERFADLQRQIDLLKLSSH